MKYSIRALVSEDIESVVEFALRAWRPGFESFERVMGSEVFRRVYPDWLASQAQAVEASCLNCDGRVWVAELDGRPVGYVVVVFHDNPARGEIDMLAVDPDCQGAGIGGALTEFAVDRIKDAGCPLAEIVTGGDPGHAPARATYEKAGFAPLPLVRYYKAL